MHGVEQRAVCDRVGPVQLHRLAKASDRPGLVPLLAEHGPKSGVGAGESGPQRNRPAMALDRFGGATEFPQHVPQVVMCLGIVPLEAQRVAVRGGRLVAPAQLLQRHAQIVVQLRNVAADRQRRHELADRLVVASQPAEGGREADAIVRVAGRKPDRPVQRLGGLVEPASAVQRRPQQMAGLGVVRLQGQNMATCPRRARGVASRQKLLGLRDVHGR